MTGKRRLKAHRRMLASVKRLNLGTMEGWGQVVRLFGLAFILARCKRDDNGCMIWQGAVNGTGYGVVRFNGTLMYAHRFAMYLARGPIRKGQLACHTCDVRLCCEPSHLYPGTYSENLVDAWERNRRVKEPLTLVEA